MENALLYTFSTVAQSLAAAIALLGAFVLYRLDILSAEIRRRSDMILDTTQIESLETRERERAKDANARGDFASVLEISSVRITAPSPAVEYSRRRLRALLQHERAVMRWFWISLVMSVGVISASVVLITWVPRLLLEGERVQEVFLDGALVAFFVCLVSYGMLLRSTLASSSLHER